MKSRVIASIVFFLVCVSCNQEDKFGALRKSVKSNLSSDEFKKYIDMNDVDFNKVIENCEKKEMGEKVKEISKVDVCRRILESKSELSDTEMVEIIENIKSDFKLRKAALCW